MHRSICLSRKVHHFSAGLPTHLQVLDVQDDSAFVTPGPQPLAAVYRPGRGRVLLAGRCDGVGANAGVGVHGNRAGHEVGVLCSADEGGGGSSPSRPCPPSQRGGAGPMTMVLLSAAAAAP